MNSGPRGRVGGQRAVIIAACVVHVPEEGPRIEALQAEPVCERNAVQGFIFRGASKLQGNSKGAAFAELGEQVFEPLKLVAVFLRETDSRLDTILPAAVKKESFLRRKREIALFPLVIFEDPEILEELTNVNGLRARNRNIVGGPGIGGDFVFSPAGISTRLGVHFEKNKISEAALAKTPSGAETRNSASNDNHGKFFRAFCRRKRGAVAQEVAHLEGVVDKRSFNLFF